MISTQIYVAPSDLTNCTVATRLFYSTVRSATAIFGTGGSSRLYPIVEADAAKSINARSWIIRRCRALVDEKIMMAEGRGCLTLGLCDTSTEIAEVRPAGTHPSSCFNFLGLTFAGNFSWEPVGLLLVLHFIPTCRSCRHNYWQLRPC